MVLNPIDVPVKERFMDVPLLLLASEAGGREP
jgi:hypothetical protein